MNTLDYKACQIEKAARVTRIVQNSIIGLTAALSGILITAVGRINTRMAVDGAIKLVELVFVLAFIIAWYGMVPCGVAYMLCCVFHSVYLDKKYAKKSIWKPKGAGVPMRLTSYPPEIQKEVDKAFSLSFKVCYGVIIGAVVIAFVRGLICNGNYT